MSSSGIEGLENHCKYSLSTWKETYSTGWWIMIYAKFEGGLNFVLSRSLKK